MKKFMICLFVLMCFTLVYGQSSKHYSAVNPALFTYHPSDVYIKQPDKYNNGTHMISPDPTKYPWEERLENGMPCSAVDGAGNVSVYFSSFLLFSPTPPSKVGVLVYTNTTNNIMSWSRPDAGLYWFDRNGTTPDQKILPAPTTKTIPTNIVAVDIESLGIYDDGSNTPKPIKTIYMPQREFEYRFLGAYEMPRTFNDKAILSGFYQMKTDRLTAQKVLTFKNINADTHMNWMVHDDQFYITSRINSRRSALNPGEVPPFTTDPRKRFRRSTITNIGDNIETKNTTLDIVLDYPVKQWEPYGMQPFRLPGFEEDVWFGLVTVYGVEGYPDTERKQRTELAYTNNGEDWYYLKPGVPFLDNGTSPQSNDFGCINISTPVYKTKLHGSRNPNDPFFFYASSKERHVEGRNPGVSLASSNFGKIAGLKSESEKIFYSMSPSSNSSVSVSNMLQFSIRDAFAIGANFCPSILGDITDDPTGKLLTELNSYACVRLFVFDASKSTGLGSCLGGALGSSVTQTHNISNDYHRIGLTTNGIDGTSKEGIFKYLREVSAASPSQIISLNDFPEIPIVLETRVKNATFYGVKFDKSTNNTSAFISRKANDYTPSNVWTYKPPTPVLPSCYQVSFESKLRYPNTLNPTQMEKGTIAVSVKPQTSTTDQTILKMYGDDANYITVDYTSTGSFRYRMVKEGSNFVNMMINPPSGNSFANKDVTLTLEAVNYGDRKYYKSFTENTSVMRVKCANINFEQVISQDIIWNFRRDNPTPVDSSYARGYAYIPFSGFVGSMQNLIVGGSSPQCANRFTGSIYEVQVAEKLPSGSSDFWNNSVSNVAYIESEKKRAVIIPQ